MVARRCPALKRAIKDADLVVPDGIGIVIFLRSLGYRSERIAGIDLADQLMACLGQTGGKVFLLGGKPGVAATAGERLVQEFPGLQVVGTMDGFFPVQDEANIMEKIVSVCPDLLIVGMGAPRQELWLERHWADLKVPIGIGVGGGIDIWAGHIRRAPSMMRRLGMEWLYRVWLEPHRWRRLVRIAGFMIAAAYNLRWKRVSERWEK